jgi:hypothetical protein
MLATRLALAGILLVVIGWALLLAAAMPQTLVAGYLHAAAPFLRQTDVAAIAPVLVQTGLGFAIIGALRQSLAPLAKFFETILARTARPAAVQGPTPVAVEPNAMRIFDRGWIRDRPYVLYADGSAEVQTLVGPRRFETLQDARDFLGDRPHYAA